MKGRGGKRKGAGRPSANTVTVWLNLRKETATRLRKMIPRYQRSDFVSDLIDANL
jgi:hypothetical protein